MRSTLCCAIAIDSADPNRAAYATDLPGRIPTGGTVEQTPAAVCEAVEFHLDGIREDGLPVPQPSSPVQYVDIAA